MVRRLVRAAFWAASLFALVMALLPQPPQPPGMPSDKVQHILAFAVLTALAAAGWPRAPLLRIAAGLIAFGAAIELLQAIPGLHRDSQLADLAADAVAVLATLAVVRLIRSRSPSIR